VELGLVAGALPVWVVAVLLPPLLVAPSGLEVSVRKRADPDVLPGGRDDERLDAPAILLADQLAVRMVVRDARAAPPPRDARHGVGHIDEPGDLGGVLRVGRKERGAVG